ncbi:MAG: hypothetical protein ACP6IP_03490 [Candidatus Njordarchaeia archaeon]
MQLDRKKVKLLALVLIASIMVAGAIGAVSLLKKTGISIKINVESEINALLSTEEGKYKTYVQVLANDPIVENTSIEVYRGFIDNHQLFLDSAKNKRFRNVLAHWTKRLGEEKLFRDFKTYLLVSIWFISSGDSYRVVPDKGVNYNPFRAKSSLIEASIAVKAEELKNINGTSVAKILGMGRIGVKPQGKYVTKYRWVIDPEYSVIPSDYVKTPIMLLENPETISANVEGSISLRREYLSRFRVTFAYGYNILNTPTPSLDIWSTDLFSVADYFEFSESVIVGPSSSSRAWIYIKAKPAILFEREYKELWYIDLYGVPYLVSTTPTGYQRVTIKITDVDIFFKNGIKKIRGGAELGFPSGDFIDRFFYGVTVEQADLSDNVLEPTTDEHSIILLDEIIDAYAESNSHLGVGIPVGAYLASAIASVSPYLALTVSGLSASLGYESESNIRIDGHVKNYAAYLEGDSDVGEIVYVALSNYEYTFDSDTLRVPSGIYFKFVTQH